MLGDPEVGTCGLRQFSGGGTQVAALFNPLVPRVHKIKIHQLALTDFYWLNFQRK